MNMDYELLKTRMDSDPDYYIQLGKATLEGDKDALAEYRETGDLAISQHNMEVLFHYYWLVTQGSVECYKALLATRLELYNDLKSRYLNLRMDKAQARDIKGG